MKNNYIWVFFWLLTVILIISSLIVTYNSYYVPPPNGSSNWLEATKTFLLCLGGIGVILSAYFTAANMFLQREENTLQRKIAVIENTFALLSHWDDSHYLKARAFTREIKEEKSKISDEKLIEKINTEPELQESVILITNYLEHVRFSFKSGRIDKSLFYQSLGETLIDIAKRFEPYIKTKGKQNSKDIKELIKLLEAEESK